jgi:isoquinoline 1-oxidoreductase subunit alpha
MAFTINVNGKAMQADVDADTPLLWVLRACTVHLNGQPTRSCQTPIGAVGPAKITTIEGIGATPVGKKVQAAWMELDVAQCGYCQPGQIMSATALLRQNAKPSDADIDAAMSGNICRCATYTRIRAAIKRASGQKEA